jgi:hypothetical protein
VVSETSEERSFGDTAKLFEAIDENSLKEKLEQTIKDMESMFSDKAGTEGECTNEGGDDDTGSKPFNASELPNPDDIHNHISGLMQGKLGRLAQEIAEETAQDLGEELGDVKTADQAFHKLFKNPGKLMTLVKKVGNKLEDKIKSGEIKESELLKEAGDFVSKMKDMPGMGNLKSVFGQMGMPGLGKDMKVNMGALNNMMRGAQTRDRLRAKLAKKQQEREATATATTSAGAVQVGTFSTGETVERSSRTKPSQEAQDSVTAATTISGTGTEKKKRKKSKKGKK